MSQSLLPARYTPLAADFHRGDHRRGHASKARRPSSTWLFDQPDARRVRALGVQELLDVLCPPARVPTDTIT